MVLGQTGREITVRLRRGKQLSVIDDSDNTTCDNTSLKESVNY